jgi:hypothetical protein
MNCPFCGANANRWTPIDARARFACGTVLWEGREAVATDRTIACWLDEVTALKSRIARLEEAGDECARYSTTQASDDWHAAKEDKP